MRVICPVLRETSFWLHLGDEAEFDAHARSLMICRYMHARRQPVWDQDRERERVLARSRRAVRERVDREICVDNREKAHMVLVVVAEASSRAGSSSDASFPVPLAHEDTLVALQSQTELRSWEHLVKLKVDHACADQACPKRRRVVLQLDPHLAALEDMQTTDLVVGLLTAHS